METQNIHKKWGTKHKMRKISFISLLIICTAIMGCHFIVPIAAPVITILKIQNESGEKVNVESLHSKEHVTINNSASEELPHTEGLIRITFKDSTPRYLYYSIDTSDITGGQVESGRTVSGAYYFVYPITVGKDKNIYYNREVLRKVIGAKTALELKQNSSPKP